MRKVERHEVPDFAHVVAIMGIVALGWALIAGVCSGDVMKAEEKKGFTLEDDEEVPHFLPQVRAFKPMQSALTARR
jgi:hypothetical protein